MTEVALQKSFTKTKLFTLSAGFVIFAATLAIFIWVNYLINRVDLTATNVDPAINVEEIKAIKQEVLDDFNLYTSYSKIDVYPNGLVTPTSLITACSDKAKEGCNREIADITRTIYLPKVTNAYLHIKAGVSRDGSPFGQLTEFDSVWFFIDSASSSGHLLRPIAKMNRQSDDGVTELLYDLSSLPFTQLPYDEKKAPDRISDVTNEILSIEGRHYIAAFVSTLGQGKMFEMKIGYSTTSVE